MRDLLDAEMCALRLSVAAIGQAGGARAQADEALLARLAALAGDTARPRALGAAATSW